MLRWIPKSLKGDDERCIRGFTVLEILFVVALSGLTMMAIVPFIRNTVAGWEANDGKIEVFQNARFGMDKMIREIKKAKRFSIINSDMIEFKNTESATIRFSAAKNQLKMDNESLAEYVNKLSFNFFDSDNLPITAKTGIKDDVRSIEISMTLSDPDDPEGTSVVFSSRVTLRKDLTALAVNEVNFHPPGDEKEEKKKEWIELYNFGQAPVNVNGWTLQVRKDSDKLQAYPGGGTGTTIPAGGYAIITAQQTTVYNEYGEPPPGTIKLQVNDNDLALDNTWDEIILLDQNDAPLRPVRYDKSWGGDGNGQTLERINSRWAPSDLKNWEDGGYNQSYSIGSGNTTGSNS